MSSMDGWKQERINNVDYIHDKDGKIVALLGDHPEIARLLVNAPKLKEFALKAMGILENELEQRKTSGLDEYFADLEKLVNEGLALMEKMDGPPQCDLLFGQTDLSRLPSMPSFGLIQ